MENGYFQLVNDSKGYGIVFHHAQGSGEEIRLDEVWKYLNMLNIPYDRKQVEARIQHGAGYCMPSGQRRLSGLRRDIYIECKQGLHDCHSAFHSSFRGRKTADHG